MKTIKFLIAFLSFTIFFKTQLFSQTEMVEYLKAGVEDANKLIDGYATPFNETFGNNLNNGWYNTAAPLKWGRFNLQIGATASFIPNSKEVFTIDPAEYNFVTTSDGNPITTSTIFGGSSSGNLILGSGINTISFNTPSGIGLNISPLPYAQLNFGIPKGFELMIRWLPPVSIDGGKTQFFGLGVKHNLKQWFPIMSDKLFDLSFIGAFTSANLSYEDNFLKPEEYINNPEALNYDNQKIVFNSFAWNMNLIISRKFSVFTPFGGFRLSNSSTDLLLKGNYPITKIDGGVKQIYNLIDPINLKTKGIQFGINGGFRLKLGFFGIFAEGTYAPVGYSSASAGILLGYFN